jgi:ribosomal protein S18 acetylase RimI-like enzyme
VADAVELVQDVDDAEIEAISRAGFSDAPGGPRADLVERQLAVHRRRDGCTVVGAVEGGVLLGFVSACTGQRGQPWTDHIARLAPEELADTWIGGHLEVVELAVVPAARGRGIGTALMEAIVADRAEPCALLTTWRHDAPARRLVERLGWIELLHDLDPTTSLYGRLLR